MMTSRFNLPTLLLLFQLGISGAYAQKPDAARNIRSLGPLFETRKTDIQYLDSANTFLFSLASQGIFYPKDTLLRYLEPYRSLAWSDDPLLRPYRAHYFDHLASNARMQNKLGEAIYFFDKLEQERRISGQPSTREVLMQKCYLFTQNMMLGKATKSYERERIYFEKLPQEIRNGKVDRQQISNALYTLSPIVSAYAYSKDSAKAASTLRLSQSILSAINKKVALQPHDRTLFDFIVSGMKYVHYRNIFTGSAMAYQSLNDVKKIINTPGNASEQWKAYFRFNLATWYMDYFTEHKKSDSALYYLNMLKKMPRIMPEEDFNIMADSQELKIWSLQHGSPRMTALIDHLLESKDTLIKNKNEELSDLLYAFTDAEFNQRELEESQGDKQRRTLWALFAGFSAILATITAYFIFQRSERKLQQSLSTLNNSTNLTIATMRESHQQSLKAEREQLAQDLHDGFSASIASAGHQVQALLTDTGDPVTIGKLEKIQAQLHTLYEHSREKSHFWYRDALVRQQASFTETIRFIADNALPDTRYRKEIQLDQQAVSNLSLEQRIVLLRVTQEGLTNVLKHARATEVSIFLFSANGHVIFQLSDNGIGLNADKIRRLLRRSDGLGWSSITSRVMENGGKFTVSSEDGLLLTVDFPHVLLTK